MKKTISIVSIIAIVVILDSCAKNSSPNPTPAAASTTTSTANPWTKPTTFLDNKNVFTFCSMGGNLFIGTGSGRYRSTDSGSNWSSISNGLTDSTNCSVFTDGTALYTTKDGISGTTSAKIYKSINNGTTWALFCNTGGFTGVVQHLDFIGTNIFVSGSNNIYKSADNGVTWALVYSGSLLTSIQTDGTNLFATDNYKLLKSVNNGSSFSIFVNDTITSMSMTSNLAIIGTKLFLAASYSKGVFISSNSGSNWSRINTGIVGAIQPLKIIALYSESNNLFATSTNRIFTTSNYGASWSILGTDIPTSSASNQISTKFILKTGGYVYAITSAGLYKIAN